MANISNDSFAMSDSKRRWQLLSTAIRTKKYRSLNDTKDNKINDKFGADFAIESFGFIVYSRSCSEKEWIKCEWNNEIAAKEKLSLEIKLVPNHFQILDLSGFDNSGNVRIWHSEEVLGYLVANSFLREKLKNKVICELGAGMSGLASLIIANLNLHHKLYITDGNQRCVENIKEIVRYNHRNMDSGETFVRKLRWDTMDDYQDLSQQIDIIIAADCLFDSSSHCHLVNVIDCLLKYCVEAQAFILAPMRNQKLNEFISKCSANVNLSIQLNESYDSTVYKTYEKLRQIDSNRYRFESCYPCLLIINRKVVDFN
ncbi:Calmodulin-lysine N-methyltransferase [Sarcoptes scabiei]|uniref:Calmodulin-lysine N-methyltransferase n=1 Tax=Sarcoptes scabiei TaxID=52283 RepID=A0A834VEZ2_SARSC|nr:Calmodulin-lysine N-methyltransferase [Sarcoptes scabiei]UXI15256.1 Kelch domain-containing protein 10 [Sarcoptes scabiei]